MRYVAIDSRGRELAVLEGVRDFAHAFDEAVIKGRVPGAVNVIGDNADGEGDMKAAESQLVAAFQEGGLSEKEAKIAARGRYDPPTRILRTIHVPRDEGSTATRSSSMTNLSERESMQERERRSVELREPGSIDLASGELSEFTERGARNSGSEALTDLYRAFRADGMSEKAAMVAARGRGYRVEPARIREDSQAMGEETPIAYARRMEFPAPDGSVSAQWKIDCPWCKKMHLNPDPPTTEDISGLLGGPQAMLCRLGDANVVDSPPPEPKTTRTVVPSGEAARDELAKAEARLIASFREGGLSEAEAKIAARGRR